VASVCSTGCSWLLRRSTASFQPNIHSFSDNEMRTFSRIRAHQSTSETFNLTHVCEGEKQSQLLSITSPLWFWRRIRLVVHFRYKFLLFCVVEHHVLKTFVAFHHNVKNNLFHFSTNIPAMFPVYWLVRGTGDRYCCLQWQCEPSHLSCFSMIHLDVLLLLNNCTAG